MTPDTRKHRRAQQIAQCVAIVARHFEVDPLKVVGNHPQCGEAIRNARFTLWYHLYDCGMSYAAIGKVFGRPAEAVERGARQGVIRLMGSDREMIERLPRIETTLEISHSEPDSAADL